jgi:hypothetical protein
MSLEKVSPPLPPPGEVDDEGETALAADIPGVVFVGLLAGVLVVP